MCIAAAFTQIFKKLTRCSAFCVVYQYAQCEWLFCQHKYIFNIRNREVHELSLSCYLCTVTMFLTTTLLSLELGSSAWQRHRNSLHAIRLLLTVSLIRKAELVSVQWKFLNLLLISHPNPTTCHTVTILTAFSRWTRVMSFFLDLTLLVLAENCGV